jgi:Zn-dependent protease
MSSNLLAIAPIWYVVFLFSTVCHEAAHALVAKWGGDTTAYAGGQVTLDPIPHLRREPLGLFFIPIVTFLAFQGRGMLGWGSAPYDPFWQIRYPRRAALMALAGPVTNFLLAIASAGLMILGIKLGLWGYDGGLGVVAPGDGMIDALTVFLGILLQLNIILGVFNLLPVPPLDGHSVLGLLLPEDLFLKFLEVVRSPFFSLLGILIAYELFPYILMPALVLAQSCFRSALMLVGAG